MNLMTDQSNFAFMELFAALVDRDMCLDCGGSGYHVVDNDGEPEFDPCTCTQHVDEIKQRYLPLFLNSFHQVLTGRVMAVEWDSTLKNDALKSRLTSIIEIVTGAYLLGGFKCERVTIDDNDVIELAIRQPARETEPIVFTGNTFEAVFKAAVKRASEEVSDRQE